MNKQKEITPQKKPRKSWTKRVLKVAIILCCIGIVAYAGLIGYVYYMEVHVDEVTDPTAYDSIIVLGAEVKPTGEPSVQLQWRLDRALEMYIATGAPYGANVEAVEARTDKRICPVVVCGAQGDNEPAPEGDVMKAVLVEAGIPEHYVYAEVSSFNTKENIANAKTILEELGCGKPLIVTTDYHLPRALSIARDVGFEPLGMGSPARSEINFWLKNHMREALSWVKYWGIKYLGLPL